MNEEYAGFEEMRLSPLESVLDSVGLSWADVSPAVRSRLEKLARETKIIADERQATEYADALADALTEEERRVVKQATLFTDIGKTGPREASRTEQDLITRIYAIDTNFNPGKVTLQDFLQRFYPGSAERDLALTKKMGIDPSDSMRSFFNLHAGWSFDLLSETSLSDDVVIAASNHHLLEGVHPGDMLLSDGTVQFRGTERPIDDRDVFVILLDKYDARLRRGGATHEAAIGWLTEYVVTNTALDKFPSELRNRFLRCIRKLDVALAGRIHEEEQMAAK